MNLRSETLKHISLGIEPSQNLSGRLPPAPALDISRLYQIVLEHRPAIPGGGKLCAVYAAHKVPYHVVESSILNENANFRLMDTTGGAGGFWVSSSAVRPHWKDRLFGRLGQEIIIDNPSVLPQSLEIESGLPFCTKYKASLCGFSRLTWDNVKYAGIWFGDRSMANWEALVSPRYFTELQELGFNCKPAVELD